MDLAEELIEIYPQLERYARSRTRNNAAIAQDCVQETIYRIINRNMSFEDKTHLKKFAFVMVKNAVNDIYRASQRISDEEIPEVAISNDGTLFRDINKVLIKMGSPCQDILEYFGMGYSYEEISEVLSIKIGTVMSRMSRCRKKFKSLLEGK